MGGNIMPTKEYWKIDNEKLQDSHIIVGMDDLEKFSFEVVRLKDIYSFEEVLKIKAFYDGKEYGTRISKVSKLDTEIVALADIGINLSRVEYIELSNLIKKNYYNLEPQEREAIENNISDITVNAILAFYREYVQEKQIEPKDGFYNIRVEDFKDEFSKSSFRRYNITDIKEALKIRKYIKCNAGRNDLAIKVDGINRRFISFDAQKLEG